MFSCACHTETKVVGGIGGAEQEWIGVQFLGSDFDHRTGFFQRCGDIFGCTALNDKALVCLCCQQGTVGFHLCFIHQRFRLCLCGVGKDILSAIFGKGCKSGLEIAVSFIKLSSSQFVGNSLGTGFGFLPIMTAVADIVGRRRITQFPGEVLCQHFRLTYVGEVLRLIGSVIVVNFGRNIAVLHLHLGIELLCRVPNGHQFLLIKRRGAFFCFLQEAVQCGFVIAVLLDDATGKAGHRCVTASFGNGGNTLTVVCHIRIEILCGQELTQSHISLDDFHFRGCGAKEETSSIQGFGIKVRENGVDQLLHFAVSGSIGHPVNGKQNVEFGACGFAVLFTHMGTAVVNRKSNAGECLLDIFHGYPIGRVLGVVIVTIHGQTIRADEVITVAIAVQIFGTDIVFFDSFGKGGGIRNLELVRIGAVAGCANEIGTKQSEHHLNTSSQVSVK